ncbi:hypothetical protein BAC1_01883 [uncultured bacterium]|nr:hypothetical protein BAC1_01883 [uncultured bacterium]
MDIDTKSVLTKKLFPSRFYDAFFISEYGRIEATRATRYNTCFSVVLIGVDGMSSLMESLEGLEFLKKLVSAVLGSVRSCDVAGLSEDRQIMVILPETDYFGALMAAKKLSRALSQAVREDSKFQVLLSQATFPRDGRTFQELSAAASRRVNERKDSLWERLGCKGKLFWEIAGSLTGRNTTAFDGASFDAGSGQDLSEFFIDQINELIIKEIARTPQRRGIMYYGTRNISASLPVVKMLSTAGSTATKVFLVGEGEGSVWEIRNAMPLLLDDPRLKETFFTFFLNEDTAYALICKENWGATYSCFHTADPVLVEGLITKFQNEYSLQEQLG